MPPPSSPLVLSRARFCVTVSWIPTRRYIISGWWRAAASLGEWEGGDGKVEARALGIWARRLRSYGAARLPARSVYQHCPYLWTRFSLWLRLRSVDPLLAFVLGWHPPPSLQVFPALGLGGGGFTRKPLKFCPRWPKARSGELSPAADGFGWFPDRFVVPGTALRLSRVQACSRLLSCIAFPQSEHRIFRGSVEWWKMFSQFKVVRVRGAELVMERKSRSVIYGMVMT